LRAWSALAAAALVAMLFGPEAAAQTYKFKTIDINAQDQTLVLGDAGGTILGWDMPSSGNPNCTLIKGKTFTTIADPNGTVTYCYGISSSGTVVGYYETSGDVAVGFTYSNGTFADFSLPNGVSGPLPLGISTNGVITGYYYQNNGPWGFVLKGSKLTTFQISGAAYVFPIGVNSHSEVTIEEIDTSGNLHCYTGSGSSVSELNYPGASQTACVGINNTGQIVGTYVDSSGANNGFAYDPATSDFYTIDYPGMADTWISGITNGQTLVGYYEASSGAPQQGLKATGSFP
jgi:probable HAF family extracellular repeat protein